MDNKISTQEETLERFFKYNPYTKVLYGFHDGVTFTKTWTGGFSQKNNANYWSKNRKFDSAILWKKIKTHEKPPIGLMTKDLYEETKNNERLKEVSGAISRYLNSNKSIDIEWVKEYNELVDKEVLASGLGSDELNMF